MDWSERIKLATEDIENLKYRLLCYLNGLEEPGVTFWERHRISIYIYGVFGVLALAGYLLNIRWAYYCFGFPLLFLVIGNVITYLWNCMFPSRK